MLYNVIIDKQKPLHNKFDWSIDNGFLTNKDAHQRIRIDDTILESFNAEKHDTDQFADINVSRYDIPNCRYVCNNRSMNPMFMNTNRAVEESDNEVIFLMIRTGFRMSSYNLRKGLKILRTFKVMDDRRITYIGCTIVFSKKDLENDNRIITLNLLDVKSGDVVTYTLNLDGDDISVDYVNQNNDKKMVEKVTKEVNEKQGRRHLNFHIHTIPGQMLTCTLVCPKSKVADVEEASKHLKKKTLIAIDDDKIEDPKAILKEMSNYEIAENHIRAITTFGMNFPKEVSADLKLIYVFKYNENTRTLELTR